MPLAVVLFVSLLSLLSVISDVNNMQAETEVELAEFKVSFMSERRVNDQKTVEAVPCRRWQTLRGSHSLKTPCSFWELELLDRLGTTLELAEDR